MFRLVITLFLLISMHAVAKPDVTDSIKLTENLILTKAEASRLVQADTCELVSSLGFAVTTWFTEDIGFYCLKDNQRFQVLRGIRVATPKAWIDSQELEGIVKKFVELKFDVMVRTQPSRWRKKVTVMKPAYCQATGMTPAPSASSAGR